MNSRKIVVLDDDPTGTQTVHDIPVYTDWEEETIESAFSSEEPLFFILTNSRSFSEKKTEEVHRCIAERVLRSSQKTGHPFLIISRSDSTLRGHFPLETETLRREIERTSELRFAGEILLPFFPEGGRFTINDIHYVRQGDELIPAAETEFAKDTTFGYHSSNLRDYCEEKTKGEYKASGVVSISLDDIRNNPGEILRKLLSVHGFQKIIVNSETYDDLRVFCGMFLKALDAGKNYLIRGSAAIVKLLCGKEEIPYLEKKDLIKENNQAGGLIVVGSHIRKSSEQLSYLLEHHPELVSFCFRADAASLEEEAGRILLLCEEQLREGKNVVVYTSRKVLGTETGDPEKALLTSTRISEAVTSIVSRLSVKPAFLLAKGGITSSDVGVKGIGIRKASVLGQILPGVPVWDPGKDSRFPGMPYIIFPGNVGTASSISDAVGKLII